MAKILLSFFQLKKGTGSLNGKTFSFQAYDKKKKKWVNLGKKKN
ncbi:hypothetical protein [Methanobrevibacter arboriphilus]|nr:hypothetical protein [Methanobrevibacter arboriphilus]